MKLTVDRRFGRSQAIFQFEVSTFSIFKIAKNTVFSFFFKHLFIETLILFTLYKLNETDFVCTVHHQKTLFGSTCFYTGWKSVTLTLVLLRTFL